MVKEEDRIVPHKEWYRLDNAAVIFSLITSRKLPAVFRLYVTLEEHIHLDRLQEALDQIIDRFPYFQVELRKGFFWYYLAHNPSQPIIKPEIRDPCQFIPIYREKQLLFLIRTYYNRIAIEFHHAITDGTGARKFLFALVTRYLELSGKTITDDGEIMRIGQKIVTEEYEDAFKRYYDRDIPHLPRYSQAFQLPFKPDPSGRFYVTEGTMDIADLKEITSDYNITITELLVAVYLDSLQRVFNTLPNQTKAKLARPIRVSVAINLRNLFPSITMRNFSLHVVAGIDPRLGHYTFGEIIKIVHHRLRVDISKKDILKQIKRNVRGEMHPLMRVTPIVLKNIFGELIYSMFGERQFSGSLSNLGAITPPGNLGDYISDFGLVPSRNKIRIVNCGVSGYQKKLKINFGNTSKNKTVERFYFRKLEELGVDIAIDTNYT